MICLSHQNWCGFFSLVTNMNSFRRTIIIQQCRDNCVAFFVVMKQRKEKRMNNTFMKKKPILPLLASMAMPMVLSMLVNSLYNIVDSFFVAKISEQAMTALSLVFPVQNFINAVAIGFGVGINAQISFQLGAKNIKNANIAATHGMLFNIIHGIIFTVICIPFMPVFLSMFTKEQEVISSGVQYSTIAFAFSTVIMISLSFEKIFQAVGRMKLTMISLMIGCISNIILDPLLIFGVGIFPEMGIRGAALATGLGQVFTVIVYLIAYKKCSIPVEISRKYLELNRNLDGKLYMVGIPAILNIALPSVLISFLNQILSAFSGSYVVVLGIYYKLQTFLYLPASGIVQGMRPLIGYNYGAGEIKRVKKLFGISVLLNGMIMLAGTIICFTASETLMGMFTENPETVRLGTAALQIISIGFIPSAISVTASGALEGLSKGAQSLVISLLRYIIVIIPAAYLLCHFAGAGAVWNAFWICEFITAVVVGIGIKYYRNRLQQ